MVSIRLGLFETNSSSVHVLVIPKDTKLTIPKKVYLTGGDYGWENNKAYDTLNYFFQACLDRGKEEVNKFIDYLKRKGVEEIEGGILRYVEDAEEYPYSGWKNEYNVWVDGYIDHSDAIPLDDLFANENLLDRFLFGDSFVQTGNDNVADYQNECPNSSWYDLDKYDIIEKGNYIV